LRGGEDAGVRWDGGTAADDEQIGQGHEKNSANGAGFGT
jgi:hypothetical protein